MASTAVTAIAITLIGIGAGVATWMAGIVIFSAFVGGPDSPPAHGQCALRTSVSTLLRTPVNTIPRSAGFSLGADPAG